MPDQVKPSADLSNLLNRALHHALKEARLGRPCSGVLILTDGRLPGAAAAHQLANQDQILQFVKALGADIDRFAVCYDEPARVASRSKLRVITVWGMEQGAPAAAWLLQFYEPKTWLQRFATKSVAVEIWERHIPGAVKWQEQALQFPNVEPLTPAAWRPR